MNRITKDTPVGTRVIASVDFPVRGVITERFYHLVTVCDENGSHTMHEDRVYLDTPADGTWAWACEQALAGRATVRDHGRVRLEFVNDTLSLYVWYHNGWDSVIIGRDDATATDWEIAK